MGLYYPSQNTFVLIGSKDSANARTSVALTNAYNSTVRDTFETGGMSKLNLDILYTTGSGETNNSIELKVEGSPDGTNFYRIPNETVSAGTSTLTEREFTFVGASAATAYAISIGLDIFYKYMRVSAKESGVVTNAGTVYIEGTLSGK